jgi:outer membrane usher protein FimD/PapC
MEVNKMKRWVALVLCTCLVPSSLLPQVGRHGGGQRVNVQNRSSNVNRNYNSNTNVNRNVNVNRDVNVNRNVNVNVHGGCYNCGYYHDNDWNWGSFAAGAAVGVATTAVVASAAHSSSNTTVVVQAPGIGSVVPALPGGCTTIASGGTMIYQCSNVYYRPYYQGTQLVYQVVTYP